MSITVHSDKVLLFHYSQVQERKKKLDSKALSPGQKLVVLNGLDHVLSSLTRVY